MIPSWRLPGATGVGDRRAGPARQQHHRPPGAGQQGLAGLVHLAQFPRGRQHRHHQRERLVLPVLAAPAAPTRGQLAAGVNGEVVSPESLDRQPPARRPASGPLPPAGSRQLGARASSSRSRGPQAGQQTGWAWNLRSAGSWYFRRARAHMAKRAIVVSGRS
jgi:hypothetical protein